MRKNKSKKLPKVSAKAKKKIKKKTNYRKLTTIGISIIIIITIGYLFTSRSATSNSSNTSSSNTSSSNKESKSEVTNTTPSRIVAGIEINKAEISSKSKFYSYESDGIKMEILAFKAKDGAIKTALNTCQVCYTSGKGYYVQEGDELVCQNCGNRFTANMVGISKGGCNPVPILDISKSDDGTKIIIDKNYLDKNKVYFSNWKA